MLEQSLIDYIKNALAEGFPMEQVRQELLKSGWQEADIAAGFAAAQTAKLTPVVATAAKAGSAEQILENALQPESVEENFFTRHQKALVVALIALVALPVLAYGGFLLYQRLTADSESATIDAKRETSARPEDTAAETAAVKARDEKRLQDIAALQIALDDFYKANKYYPKNITDLKEYGQAAPRDPKNQEPYLYKPLGEPALHYSLSFILEGRVGTMKAGLQVVSSEQRVPAESAQSQEQVVRGEVSPALSDRLLVTDLAGKPFYPGEEVRVEIRQEQLQPLESVFLVMGGLELVDTAAPFEFSFTAPKTSGTYEVQIFAFDDKGVGYLQKTSLTVQK